MNAAQRRIVEKLKAELLEAAAEQARQLNEADITRAPDRVLERKLAKKHGWMVDLGNGPFVPEITDDMLIAAIRRRRADTAGMSYEDYLALSDEERAALMPKADRPAARQEWRYSDREAQ